MKQKNTKTYKPLTEKQAKAWARADKKNAEKVRLFLEAHTITIPTKTFRLIFPSGVLSIELHGNTFCMSVEPTGCSGKKR
jgi:hypothetical protein